MADISPLPALGHLQQIDSDVERTQHEITALTNGLTDERAVRSAAALAQRTQQQQIAALLALKESEAALAATEGKVTRNNKRLTSGAITTPKDLASVEHELAFLAQTKADQEEQVLLAMDTQETTAKTAQSAAAALTRAEQDRAAERIQQTNQLATAQARLITLNEERIVAVSDIAPQFLARYDDIRKTRSKAVVAASNGVCQGCRVALLPNIAQRLRSVRDELVTCANCGRILIPG